MKIPNNHLLPCIYKATSKTNGKSYIGQSKMGLKYRKEKHYQLIQQGKGIRNKFYRSVRIRGWNDFRWSVLYTIKNPNLTEEEILDRLNKKEIEYIQKYDTVNNGYNIRKGGGNKPRADYTGLTPDEKIKIQKEKYKVNKRERHREHKEERLEKQRKRRELNKEEINRRKREYHQRPEVKARRKARRSKYRPQYLKEYRALHKEELNEKQRIRKRNRRLKKEVMPCQSL